MYSRGASFVIVLIALALVGGAVAVGRPTTYNRQPTTETADSTGSLQAAVISTRDKSTLADIERQLNMAGKTGGISPASYTDIDKKLKKLEAKKINTKKARGLLGKLEVGGSSSAQGYRRTQQQPPKAVPFTKMDTSSPPLNLPLRKGAEEAKEKKAAGVKGYWQNWETEYKPVGSIPPCPEPLVIPSPVDVSKVTSILYPGQERGGNYKAHGGFRLDNQSTNEVTVRIPLDAEFIYGSRHYQSGEVQYLLGFRMPCGIEYRLDHLLTLSPKFQELVDKHLPPPKYDSFTTEVKPPPPVKAGEIVATEVGFKNNKNVGFDFGVYDLRQKNKSSRDPTWVARNGKHALANYAVCWLDYLSPEQQRIVKGLPGADGKMGKTSDFCTTSDIVIPAPSSSATPSAYARPQSDFAAVRGEVEDAQKTGGRFSREHYERVERDLTSAEKSGASASEIERLRKILRSLTPHLADEEFARKEAEKAAAANAPCTDPPPVLTADITDFSKVRLVTAPGSASFEGPKGHSFIWTDAKRVPVYAPVAGVYDSGSYSKDHPTLESKAQYLLFFRVKGSCGWEFKFDHIDEPVESIRSQLPSEPKISDSRGTPATTLVEFKAGDLIGYTTGTPEAGNWDFGLYNMNKEGALKAHGCSATHCNSVCWPDFYAAGKKETYRKLLDGPKLVCSF